MARLLLLSNSTSAGFPYFQLWSSTVMSFLPESVRDVLFIPFAGVTIDWDDYTARVQAALPDLKLTAAHRVPDVQAAVRSAAAIMIGGGNTFNLLSELQQRDLLQLIRDRVSSGSACYIGWSAGSNVATPDIATTNDMPIVWPEKQAALSLVPFNLNPHYTQGKPPGHQGESRDDRLNEAILKVKRNIVAVSEGIGILVENDSLKIIEGPADQRAPESVLHVRVWKPLTATPYYRVIDVPLNETKDLAPFLKPEP